MDGIVKRPVRDLLAALIRIVDNDLDELRGHIVHVDEKTGRWHREDASFFENHERRVSELEAVLADNAQHSRKVDDEEGNVRGS